ncbi:MAG: pseudouridine-5'-phosphate glycosidase, partial [Acidobacteria bacterium]|nr:pseudouridine-5'-phosphate glycosidase [Acidobacteriota bacterium]
QGVHGQAVTPFLLEAMNQRSRGATLRANKALLRGNARLAAQLAVALRRR